MRSWWLKAVLAGGPPLLAYVATASGYAHWLDSGEFVAAAADFGISHPPGHPLAAIVLGAANLLPVGALSFRVALVCALLLALAAVAACFAIETSLSVGDTVRASLRFPMALAATWWVAWSVGWWFQAVRPEVYALQAALLCVALERLLRVSVAEGRDVRPLYQAALCVGLALSNHHFIALLAIIPALWLLPGIGNRFGWRPFGWSAAFAGAGLLTYLYLPFRALAEPYLNLGAPSSLGRFTWVISAEAFQKSISPEEVAPFRETLIDVLIASAEDLHLVALIVALLGAYFMLRVKPSRKYGLFWLTLWLVFVLGRAILGFVSGNPDAVAYVMLAYVAIGAFVAFALGVLLSALVEAAPRAHRLAPALGLIVVLGSTLQITRSAERASLASFVDTDAFDDGLRRALPPRAVVLAHNPQTIFRFWGGQAEELNRPDVTLIPLPLLSYPKLVDRFVRDEPELKSLLRSYVLEGRLSAPELQSLAARRPVFVEMDIRVDPELMELLVPSHLYHRVLTADTTETDESRAMRAHGRTWEDLYARIGRPLDAQTEVQLIWRHYTDSLYFAALGDTNAALRTVAAGLALNPHPSELIRLRKTLKEAAPGERIDVRPFMVR